MVKLNFDKDIWFKLSICFISFFFLSYWAVCTARSDFAISTLHMRISGPVAERVVGLVWFIRSWAAVLCSVEVRVLMGFILGDGDILGRENTELKRVTAARFRQNRQ